MCGCPFARLREERRKTERERGGGRGDDEGYGARCSMLGLCPNSCFVDKYDFPLFFSPYPSVHLYPPSFDYLEVRVSRLSSLISHPLVSYSRAHPTSPACWRYRLERAASFHAHLSRPLAPRLTCVVPTILHPQSLRYTPVRPFVRSPSPPCSITTLSWRLIHGTPRTLHATPHALHATHTIQSHRITKTKALCAVHKAGPGGHSQSHHPQSFETQIRTS